MTTRYGMKNGSIPFTGTHIKKKKKEKIMTKSIKKQNTRIAIWMLVVAIIWFVVGYLLAQVTSHPFNAGSGTGVPVVTNTISVDELVASKTMIAKHARDRRTACNYLASLPAYSYTNPDGSKVDVPNGKVLYMEVWEEYVAGELDLPIQVVCTTLINEYNSHN